MDVQLTAAQQAEVAAIAEETNSTPDEVVENLSTIGEIIGESLTEVLADMDISNTSDV